MYSTFQPKVKKFKTVILVQELENDQGENFSENKLPLLNASTKANKQTRCRPNSLCRNFRAIC